MSPIGWKTVAGLVAVGSLIAAVLLVPGFTDNTLNRLNVASSIGLTAALVWVTWRYTHETSKMARASEKQIEGLQKQLELELTPNLLLVPENGIRSEGKLNLVNLSRHHVWIYVVLNSAKQDPDEPVSIKGHARQAGLAPGQETWIHAFPNWYSDTENDLGERLPEKAPPTNRAEITVRYLYAPTGPLLHQQTWIVRRAFEGADVYVTTPEPPT